MPDSRICLPEPCCILDSIVLFRGYPATIRTDHDPEFTCRVFDQWVFEHGVELRLIQPGKPTQNGFIESFNCQYRLNCDPPCQSKSDPPTNDYSCDSVTFDFFN